MAIEDEWGCNSEVRRMRRIFRHMESGQESLIDEIKISQFDTRLPRWREKARTLFEQLWAKAAATGVYLDEAQAGHLYVHCLAHIITDDGVPVSDAGLSDDDQVRDFWEKHLS